ncbi:hypothetical protein B5X24_HaOG207093 [Helicoverpa armigera]|uniref:Uncharacterized protein n=1 Tax=Helicoverpa armigera TaxID=29058 RepID=A0A2W1BID8_HELAM|nr:hypothetical protein B5X24_HaOG207093 [Helicoverpa armigera]
MPEINKNTMQKQLRLRSSHAMKTQQKSLFESKFIVNVVSEDRFDECLNPFNYPYQTNRKVRRCQLKPGEDDCCCSCNSDAMFQVMKALYECYKKKNCQNCNCILCGHLQKEERLLGLINNSFGTIAVDATDKEQKEKVKKNERASLEGKTPSVKAFIKKARDERGLPPEPKTASDVPPEAKTKSMKKKHIEASKVLEPLQGKAPKEKERILQGLHDTGVTLPEGRTPSEKALIDKVKARPRKHSAVPRFSEKMRKAKVDGLLTPLKSKAPEERDRILRELAMRGIPLPEGQTPSDKKLIDKVRTDLGLPIEPKNKAIRDKHHKAASAGKLLPLEGKSAAQKENILQDLHDMGIPLPIGRTPSEKALIAKIMTSPRAHSITVPTEKMRKAKAEGLLTPLKGKTSAQKEKILRGLAKHGIPFSEGETPSEKQLVEKVRSELGLPPIPKTPSMRRKYVKAADAGFLQPLEGKSLKEKKKILRGLHDMGIPLPEGRTPSEKAIITKVKSKPRASSLSLKHPERIRKATAEGQTSDQREKGLIDLAMRGLPLPEGLTPSERKLIDKIREALGLPIEPKTKAMRQKYNEAAAAGKLLPLEGKTSAQKENMLRGLYDMGIPLPKGRTPSEKALIAKITAGAASSAIRQTKSERLKDAKAAGLLTPLEGKKAEQKEKILRRLAKRGLPLPEGKTPSDKKLVDRVRAEVGLPPVPKTQSTKEKYDKAQAAGLITPLEGKTTSQKKKILKAQAAMGLTLPKGRTPSEKAIIAKLKTKSTPSITTEKIRKAKEVGLLTPLTGKPSKKREKILKGLAKADLPLPEGKSPSEKALINKVKTKLGLPDLTDSEKIRRAEAAGLLIPLEGRTPAQKEKILRGRAAAGLPLPMGKSPSERALLQKIKADTGYVTPSPSERLRKAKAAGLLTPLKGKTPSVKEKILNNMKAAGVPISEGETPSEKDLIKKLTTEPPPLKKTQSEKMKLAKAAGLLTPLQGKTPEQKQKILKGLVKAGIPLPEPKTESETNLIDKIRKETGLPPVLKTPSLREKYRKAQAAGLITPLEGKTPAEQEKVLQKLHDAGLPLPEGRGSTEKALIKKIQTKPPRKTSFEKLTSAKAAGFLTPLEGKTAAQKEKILKGLAKSGILLPEGKTSSEKDLINKVRQEMGLPPEPETPSLRKKIQKAHADGLVTPLEGKTLAQKKKILQALADAGIPLPEGRTPSEKSLIAKTKPKLKVLQEKAASLERKVAAEKKKRIKGLIDQELPGGQAKTKTSLEKSIIHKIQSDLEIALTSRTSSEKSIIRKAKEAGLLTPITGKSPADKERILKGLAETGIPLPVGKTVSEKALIKKVRAEAGLAPEPTSSEIMGKIKKKTTTKPGKGIEARKIERVIKTTTCDRGCGCDKKKIKFKHSYVKIRVTSPDISSLCDCLQECIPGVTSGAFIDNDGIKVIVGRVIGVPLYSREYSYHNVVDGNPKSKLTNFFNKHNKSQYKVCMNVANEEEYVMNSNSDSSSSNPHSSSESDNISEHTYTPPYEGRRCIKLGVSKTKSRANSFDSIFVIKSETSLSLNTSQSNSMNTISVVSVMNSSISSNSTHYSGDRTTDENVTLSSLDNSITSESEDNNERTPIRTANVKKKIVQPNPQHEYKVYMMSQTKINFPTHQSGKTKKTLTEAHAPVTILSHIPTKLDLSKLMDKILKKKRYADAASIFIVIPTSDEETEDSEASENCNASNKSSETQVSHQNKNLKSVTMQTSASTNKKVCGKGNKFYMKKVSSCNDKETTFLKETVQVLRQVEMKKNQFCQIAAASKMTQVEQKIDQIVGTDFIVDSPCCCCLAEQSSSPCSSRSSYITNVMSRQLTPRFLKGLSNESLKRLLCDVAPCSDVISCNEPSNASCQHRQSFSVLKQSHRKESSSLCDCIRNYSMEIIKSPRKRISFIDSKNSKLKTQVSKTAHEIAGHRRYNSSNDSSPKSESDVERGYTNRKKIFTKVKNKNECTCTDSSLSGVGSGTTSSTGSRIGEMFISVGHSRSNQFVNQQRYHQANRRSERQEDSCQLIDQKDSCVCDDVDHVGDDIVIPKKTSQKTLRKPSANWRSRQEETKGSCVCDDVCSDDTRNSKKRTNDTGYDIVIPKTASQHLPREKRLQNVSRKSTVQNIPRKKIVQDIPCEKKVHNLPPDEAEQADDSSSSKKSKNPKRQNSPLKYLSQLIKSSLSKFNSCTCEGKQQTGQVDVDTSHRKDSKNLEIAKESRESEQATKCKGNNFAANTEHLSQKPVQNLPRDEAEQANYPRSRNNSKIRRCQSSPLKLFSQLIKFSLSKLNCTCDDKLQTDLVDIDNSYPKNSKDLKKANESEQATKSKSKNPIASTEHLSQKTVQDLRGEKRVEDLPREKPAQNLYRDEAVQADDSSSSNKSKKPERQKSPLKFLSQLIKSSLSKFNTCTCDDIIQTDLSDVDTSYPKDICREKIVEDTPPERTVQNLPRERTVEDIPRAYRRCERQEDTKQLFSHKGNCVCDDVDRTGDDINLKTSNFKKPKGTVTTDDTKNKDCACQVVRGHDTVIPEKTSSANRRSERQEDTKKVFSHKGSCVCDDVDRTSDSKKPKETVTTEETKHKADAACQVVDGYDIVIPKRTSREKSVQIIPREKSVQFIPLEKTVQDIPREKSVQIIPREKSVQIIPREKSVQGIPREKTVQDIPREKTVQNVPPDVAEQADDSSSSKKSKKPKRESSSLKFLSQLIKSSLSKFNSCTCDDKQQTGLVDTTHPKDSKDLKEAKESKESEQAKQSKDKIPVASTERKCSQKNVQDVSREKTVQDVPPDKVENADDSGSSKKSKSPKRQNSPLKFLSQLIKSSLGKLDSCKCPDKNKTDLLDADTSHPKDSKNLKEAKESKESEEGKKSKKEKAADKTHTICGCNDDKANKKEAESKKNLCTDKTPQSQKSSKNKPSICSCKDDKDNKKEAKSKKNSDTGKTPKSRKSSSKKHSICCCNDDKDNKKEEISQPPLVSNSEVPQLQPSSSSGKTPQAQPMSDSEQNPQSVSTSGIESSSQPTCEIESSPQSSPMSPKKSSLRKSLPPSPVPGSPISEPNPLLEPTSESESSPHSTPMSPRKSSLRKSLPPSPVPDLPISEPNLLLEPTSESESSPQSTPMSPRKSLPPSPVPGSPVSEPQRISPPIDSCFPKTEQTRQLCMQPSAEYLPPEGYSYEEIGPSCGWVDMAEVIRRKSEWSQYTSGFKACKRKKAVKNLDVPQEEIELDFEDAVKYYASTHPELFRDLMQQELQKKIESETDLEQFKGKEGKKLKKIKEKERKQREKARKKAEKEKNRKDKKTKKKGKRSSDSDEEVKQKNSLNEETCRCPYGPVPLPPYASTSEEWEYPRGLKMCLGGKYSTTPGLKGVACFKMTQESQSLSTIFNQESLISW